MSRGGHRTRWSAAHGARLALAGGLGLALAACARSAATGGGSSATGGSATLEIAAFSPFTGPNAAYGYFQYTGCVAAVHAINAAGGVSGHHFTCTIVDNRGEPADAVPAANNMLASSPHLIGIVDGDSGLMSATVPLFNQAHIPDLSAGGDVQFDKNTYPVLLADHAGRRRGRVHARRVRQVRHGLHPDRGRVRQRPGRPGQRAGPRLRRKAPRPAHRRQRVHRARPDDL